MCLRATPVTPVPEDTTQIARAAFPKGNRYLHLRDELGTLFTDEQFADLFSPVGQPALSPGRLALVTLLQFAEGLSDRQAAEAVRSRIDWKYCLGLPLADPGFDSSVLSEFRHRLLDHKATCRLFDQLLAVCRSREWLPARLLQRTDSTHIVAAVRALNRLEMLGETLRLALEALAREAPEVLRQLALADWGVRYAQRFEDYRLPKTLAQRDRLAVQIGADGAYLLRQLFELQQTRGPGACLWQLTAVQQLRAVWVQQFSPTEHGAPALRPAAELPPAPQLLCSPTDPEARFSQKRTTLWTGYKVHFTETCAPELPHLVTGVETTVAPVPDTAVLPAIQSSLAQRDLLPDRQYVDAGYTEARAYLDSREKYGITLVGPTQADPSWQARDQTGFASAAFTVHWEQRQVVCPAGRTSAGWKETRKQGRPVVQVHFAHHDCRVCPHRAACTRSELAGRRLTLQPKQAHQVLQTARQAAQDPAFRQDYAHRAGVEGTHSQMVRQCKGRRCRYVGLARTRLQYLMIAAALNLSRISEWLMGTEPARTRTTKVKLILGAAA